MIKFNIKEWQEKRLQEKIDPNILKKYPGSSIRKDGALVDKNGKKILHPDNPGFDAWDILFDKIVKNYDYEEIAVGLLNYLIDTYGPAKTIEIVKKAKKYMEG